MSGLKHWLVGLYKAFSMQDTKCCSMDWCSCINTNVNDAVLYIVTFFNYTEAFSLLRLATLTITGTLIGFQESCKTCHLLECPFNSWRVFTAKDKVFPSDRSFIHITTLIHRYYFYKSERKVHHNTLKTSTHIFFWIQWHQTTKIMATKGGVCQIHLKFNVLQRESIPETFNFRNLF